MLETTNRVANYFASQGYKKGDSIALFMENKPEYICVWLGLAKVVLWAVKLTENKS
jgi:solute carrier family 27 fatty acid transporter 1/4